MHSQRRRDQIDQRGLVSNSSISKQSCPGYVPAASVRALRCALKTTSAFVTGLPADSTRNLRRDGARRITVSPGPDFMSARASGDIQLM